MSDQTPSGEHTASTSSTKSSRKTIAAISAILIVVAVVAVVSASNSTPSFTPNSAAYCAAGKAWTNVTPCPAAQITTSRIVRYLRASAADFGRVAAAAPNQKISDAFVALQHSYLAEVSDPKALAAGVFFGTHPMRLVTYSDAITRQRIRDAYAAFKDAEKSVAAECSSKSTFSFIVSASIYAEGQKIAEFGDTPDQQVAFTVARTMQLSLKSPSLTLTSAEIVKDMSGAPGLHVMSVKVDGADVRFVFKSGPAVCTSMPSAKGPAPGIVTCP